MPRGPARTRLLVVVALVAVLALGWLPWTLQDDLSGARRDARMSAGARDDARGPAARAGSDLALVRAARRRMPPHASFALVRGGIWGSDAHPNTRRAFVWESGQSWTQFALAPRMETDASRASWLLIRDASPMALGESRPGREWRFGRDWLVRLR
ncbi:MAG TPA: hypothetical protein VGF46_12100 [Gaiellales bacterium]